MIVMNLYYSGEGTAAQDFVREMEASGIADRIRKEDGNLRYSYFISTEDDSTVLLIDAWRDQEALDVHHQSDMMAEIAQLRDKYDLHMKAERYVPVTGEEDASFLRK